MQVCLVSAATATDFEDSGEAASVSVRSFAEEPHLGVLSLAAVLEQGGLRPRVIDLNRLYYEYLGQGLCGVEPFAEWAAGAILSHRAELYGFGSICSSYPLTLRIARNVKRAQPDKAIVLGGPQASVVDLSTLAAFPFVDFILRGEAEQTLPLLLEELGGPRRFQNVAGLTWRSPFGPARTSPAPLIQDLDSLPLPAFHLTGGLTGQRSAPLELGRGCPFSCTFCSTNDFFRRKFRVKSPGRMLADMRAIAAQYGIRYFKLAHDMFTVDRRRVVEFCECLLASGENFRWGASARTDSVDAELLELMAHAGCTGLFFGVEVGSARMQKIIDKGLDIDEAKRMISTAERFGMNPTVSMITGFPEEAWEDQCASVDMYMYATRHPGCDPQFNVLAPLAETPIYARHKDELILDNLCSDMSHQGRIQNQADRELIRQYPEIFPNFYLLPTPGLDRPYFLELREFLLMGLQRLRWLMVALHQAAGITSFFSAWRQRRLKTFPELTGGSLRHYYIKRESRNHVVDFASECAPEFRTTAVEALLEYYRALVAAEALEAPIPAAMEPVADSLAPMLPGDIPRRKAHIHAFAFDFDMQGVIDSLKRGEPAQLARGARAYRTKADGEDSVRLVEISPLLAHALDACDGCRTAGQIVEELMGCFEGPADLCHYGVECLLEGLQSQGLLDIYRTASRAEPSQEGAASNCEYSSMSASASSQNVFSIQAQ